MSAAGRAVRVHPMCGRWYEGVVFGDILDEEGKAVAAELADAARYGPSRRYPIRAMDGCVVDTAVTAFGGLHAGQQRRIGTIETTPSPNGKAHPRCQPDRSLPGHPRCRLPMKEAGRGPSSTFRRSRPAGTVACHGYTASSSPCGG